ncbi:MAG: dihydropteroate synthase [Woeseiaceae bacterium]
MGVLNVTPDSFSDGGRFSNLESALHQARSMIADGAAIIDVGGESTRPGADSVSVQKELDRVVPVIEAIRAEFDVTISIDTSKPTVMCDSVSAGATMINDVCALQVDGALEAAVELQKPVCLMHMQGDPRSMQADPQYDDVVEEVTEFLRDRVAQCVAAGLNQKLLVVDPGFGFGKTVEQNIELLANLRQFQDVGCPVLIGVSRKSTLGEMSGRDVEDRVAASVAAATVAVMHGADIIRAHDVRATVDAVNVAYLLSEAGRNE